MSFRALVLVVTAFVPLVLSGCVQSQQGGIAEVGGPTGFVATVAPKGLVYELKDMLIGPGISTGIPASPTRVDHFEVPSNATQVNTVAELRCAAGAIGRIVFEWTEEKSVQTAGEYTMVGDFERDVCVTSGPDPPFQSPNLGPGNHTVSYYVMGIARAHVEVVVTFG